MLCSSKGLQSHVQSIEQSIELCSVHAKLCMQSSAALHTSSAAELCSKALQHRVRPAGWCRDAAHATKPQRCWHYPNTLACDNMLDSEQHEGLG